MGDRCSMYLTCRKEDVPLFEEFGFEVDDENGNAVLLLGDEMNYSLASERSDLAHDGIPFYGTADAGIEYPACAFASCDGEQIEVVTDGDDVVVRFNEETGEPRPEEIARARAYFALLKRAKAAVAVPAEVEV